jgi:hypothetical protein
MLRIIVLEFLIGILGAGRGARLIVFVFLDFIGYFLARRHKISDLLFSYFYLF